jgi:hypothetical protein
VPATAVTEAGDMPDEDLIRAERMTVQTPDWRTGDPPAGRVHQIAQHACKPSRPQRGAARPGHLSDIGQRRSSVGLAG